MAVRASHTLEPPLGEETSDTMNLDLNLGPAPEPESESIRNIPLIFDDWSEEHIGGIRHRARLRAGERLRWRRVEMPPESQSISMELNQLMVNSNNAITLHSGEGSVATEERSIEVPKSCENNNGILEENAFVNKDEFEKDGGNDGSFFDCNVCLDLAKDPVVTCCGHLFCWPCIYRWLNVHSDAKECPVCKGEVTTKTITPIYGRGNHTHDPDDDSSLKIPLRPHAQRVESLRQTIQRTTFTFPMEEMIRRIGSRYDLSRDLVQPPEPVSASETAERTHSLLNRIFTSRGLRMRREQIPAAPVNDVVDLTQDNLTGSEAGENHRLQSLLFRRTQSQRATLSSFSTALSSSAERFVEAYFRSPPSGRDQEQSPVVDDRDSFSSIAAVINSESQMDTAVEIDSMVSLSTSSSRRRTDSSRVLDVDSGDSRAHRRRRLN